MKRSFLFAWIFITSFAIRAQVTFIAGEYFFDADPGQGNATPVPGFSPAIAVDITFQADASALSPGMHVMGVRLRSDTDTWSMPTYVMIYVSGNDPSVAEDIVSIEYFFDTDPGPGNGTEEPGFTASADIAHTFSANTSSLAPGMHVMGIRTMNSLGAWSMPAYAAFYVEKDRSITKLEYFVGADPGFGNATSIHITPSLMAVDMEVEVNTNTLETGNYTLSVRAGRADEAWSDPFIVDFSICSPPVADFTTDTVCVGGATSFTDNSTNTDGAIYEWDFDSDGTVDNTTVGNVTFTYPVSGTYTATLFVDRLGCTDVSVHTVSVVDAAVSDSGPDHAICGDATTMAANTPAPGTTGVWSIVSGSADVADPTDPATSVTNIASGSLILEWTVTHAVGGCSAISQTVVTTSPAPVVDFSADTVCEGNETTFTDSSFNTGEANYTWDYDGDGVSDATGMGATTYTYPSGGTYNAALTIESNGCSDTGTILVTVEPAPVVVAGDDQDLCENETTLAAGAPSVNEQGVWSVVSGVATVADPADPATKVSHIASYETILRWTLTNTVGGCAGFDELTIISNQPITAALVTAVVNVEESVNGDVQAVAITNPGDVLTTSIVTAPVKGKAIVENNNVIIYTAAAGTVGPDVVVYQICNQCNHCATGDFAIEIANNPPVITPPVITVQPGNAVNIDLLEFISDPNNNLDPASLAITQPPGSGAAASIDASYHLIIDYTGITFSGTDELAIEACDLAGVCSQNLIAIMVNLPPDPPVQVYNAVSPDGDGRHDFLEIENIEAYPDNHIYIVNRWGDKVFEARGYNNNTIRFEGIANIGGGSKLLPGTYYYRIDLGNGDRISGFLVLKQ